MGRRCASCSKPLDRRPAADGFAMKICLYTETALPTIGGQELVVNALAGYTNQGHDIVVLAPTPRRGFVANDSRLSYRVIRHRRDPSTRRPLVRDSAVGWGQRAPSRQYGRAPAHLLLDREGKKVGRRRSGLSHPTTELSRLRRLRDCIDTRTGRVSGEGWESFERFPTALILLYVPTRRARNSRNSFTMPSDLQPGIRWRS